MKTRQRNQNMQIYRISFVTTATAVMQPLPPPPIKKNGVMARIHESAPLTQFAAKINAQQFLSKSRPISWLETWTLSTQPHRHLCRGIFVGFIWTNPKIRKYTVIKEKLLCRLVSNLISTILFATAPFSPPPPVCACIKEVCVALAASD